ncbi:hypothetical protein diail_2469 [Diaporthe ilicicola]|nr:hypothetical protein diail_2469 [Diaporthe ilicicola]
MLIISSLSIVFGLWVTLSHQSGFTSPNYVVSYGSGQYESNALWYVGQTKEVVYDISDIDGLNTYTVALWQQSVAGGGATLGPVVNSESNTISKVRYASWANQITHTDTSLPDVRSSFTWTVELYDFDVSLSNVFFFWIFNGSALNQGDINVPNVSSAYFNITTDDPPGVSSSTSSATTSRTTPMTSNPSSSTATATASSIQFPQVASTSATSASTPEESESSASGAGSSGGISTGAGVGIGVGVGVVGISAVVCASIIVWYKRKKRGFGQKKTQSDESHELPSSNNGLLPSKHWHSYQDSSTHDSLPNYRSESGTYTEHSLPLSDAINHGFPVELNSERDWPVELDGDGRDEPRIRGNNIP